jgi:ankyrin repeat protein
VNLQFDNLCQISEAQRDELVEQALHKLPKGLDETYIRIVRQIEEQSDYMRDLALRALMWILYAKRPLSTEELQHALATDRAYQSNADINSDPVDVILKACGNLVAEEHDVVRPVHYSIQEFFTSRPSGTFQGLTQRSLIDSELVHETLACVCIRYMRLGKLNAAPCQLGRRLFRRVIEVAFACYATQYFDYHIYEAKTLSPELSGLLDGLLKQNGANLAAVLQLRMVNSNSLIDSVYNHFSSVTFTVDAGTIVFGTRLFEIDEIRTHWLEDAIPQYALHQASRTGSLNAVRWLLDSKIEVNEKDNESRSPIYYAAMEGHTAIIAILCEHGADSNTQGGYYGHVLQAACFGGYLDAVKVLLTNGADVNAQGGEYGNALYAACDRGHLEVVKELLVKGAEVNAQGGKYGNALQAACSEGHVDVVEELLAKGANVNAQGGEYGNALQAACTKGYIDIVIELLAKGAKINAEGGKYSNALYAACDRGHLEVVDELMAKGAEVNAHGGRFGSTLQAACLGGHLEVVEELLANGADVNWQGGQYDNALYAACLISNLDMVKQLLAKGADINAQSGYYGNVLQVACFKGHLDVVEELLAKGAEVNAQGLEYGSALQAACSEGYASIVKELLAHGAKVNTQGGLYGSLLQAAQAKCN